MAITNYTQLQSSIASWLLRDDLTAVIPDFITLAEAQFNREIRNRKMIKRATATIDSQYSAVPSDWLQNVDLVMETNPVTTLQFVTSEQLDRLRGSNSTTGNPAVYTVVGQELEVLPVPASNSTLTGELTYYGKIDALSASTATNWLLNSSPDIYLYGTLLQSAPYLVEDERIAVWGGIYTKLINDLNISDSNARIGDSTLRIRATALQ